MLKEKKAMVTGAAGGIRRNVAAAFVEAGADVDMVDILAGKEYLISLAKEIAAKYQVNVFPMCFDISDVKQFMGLKATTPLQEMGTLHVAFLNVGNHNQDDHRDITTET